MPEQKTTLDFSRRTLLAGAALAALVACDAPVSNGGSESAVDVEVTVAAAPAEATADATSPTTTDAENGADAVSRTRIRIVGNDVVALGEADLVYVDGVRVEREAEAVPAQPLLYVDGVRVDHGGASRREVLDALDPASIDRVEVLKGPAAVELYGDEASNGVIQIFLHEEEDADVVRKALGSVLSGIGQGISRTGEGIKKAGERLRKK